MALMFEVEKTYSKDLEKNDKIRIALIGLWKK